MGISFLLSIIILIIVTILMPLSLIFFYELIFIVSLISFSFFIVLTYILFSKFTNKYPREISASILTNSFKNSIKLESIIHVVNNNGTWYFNKDEDYSLELKGYFFQKSFIRSFIIRQLRYDFINKERSIKKLFKLKVFLPKLKDLNITICFHNKKKTKFKKILVNGVSKHSVLSQMITQARFYKKYLFMKSMVGFLNTEKRNMNEKWYLNLE